MRGISPQICARDSERSRGQATGRYILEVPYARLTKGPGVSVDEHSSFVLTCKRSIVLNVFNGFS